LVITEDFREKVNKAARAVAGRNTQVEWEDLSQDMWVWMLENPTQYQSYIEMEDPFKQLQKIAKQELYKQNSAYQHFTGNYVYTPGEVRGLLSEYLIDVTLESVSEHVDLVEGLLLLKNHSQRQFNTIINKWVHGSEGHTGRTTEAVDKLTSFMNQVNDSARYSYEGPGSRRVLSNSQSTAQSWNQQEQSKSNGTNWS
jgi:hypothetical protein